MKIHSKCSIGSCMDWKCGQVAFGFMERPGLFGRCNQNFAIVFSPKKEIQRRQGERDPWDTWGDSISLLLQDDDVMGRSCPRHRINAISNMICLIGGSSTKKTIEKCPSNSDALPLRWSIPKSLRGMRGVAGIRELQSAV